MIRLLLHSASHVPSTANLCFFVPFRHNAGMEYIKQHQTSLAFIAGIVIAYTGGTFLKADDGHFHRHDETNEYHIHTDTLMIINDEIIDKSDPKYMSSIEQILHPDAHFHDESDNIMHLHAEGISLGEFYGSLGFTLTDTCLTVPGNEPNCTNEANELLLFINSTPTTSIASYVPSDNDRLLIYYGVPDADTIPTYLEQITDESCIYSGTCPERGMPPPESCGLTCEI